MGNSESGNLGFKKGATCDEVIEGHDLRKWNVVITGTTRGIGKETARVFYKKGANVYSFNRNLEKTGKVHENIRKAVTKENSRTNYPGNLYEVECDLSSQESIIKSVETFTTRFPDQRVNLLFCNAGVGLFPRGHTVDGFERVIGINHFGHFTLTMLLLPVMNEPSRIIMTSSYGHITPSSLNFDDFNYYTKKRDHSKFNVYGESKLCNVLFARELNRLLKLSKKDIISLSLHPGMIHTKIGSESLSFDSISLKLMFIVGDLTRTSKSVSQGASTQVLISLSDNERLKEGGHYCEDNQISVSSRLGRDMNVAKKVFKMSLKDTNTRFPFECEDEDEDVNDLEDVKSSRPKNWRDLIKGRKLDKDQKNEEPEEEEGEIED